MLTLLALGIPLSLSIRDRVNTEVRGQAASQAEVVASSVAEGLAESAHPRLGHLVNASARSVRGRVLVVDARGAVVADSAGPATVGASYASRSEIQTALAGSRDQLARASNTLNEEILATATPIVHGGRTLGAVRITQSVAAVNRAVRSSILGLALLGTVVLLLGLIAGALIAQQIARPIRRLDAAAQSVTAGALDTRVPVDGSSEQRSLARTFNAMTERVQRLVKSQRDFVADASHQLRTPLTGLRLQLEELGETTPSDDPRSTRIRAGLHEVDRLSLLVDELLILSRAGEHELPAEEVELSAAAAVAVERWGAIADEAGVALDVAREAGSGSAWCAPADLDRALDCLIENAIRYSPTGGAVTVSAAGSSISVLDRGPGLKPGEEEAVFKRFSRGSAGLAGPEGAGLGLAIAREVIGAWGAHVSLNARRGGGAVAAVDFEHAGERSSNAKVVG